MLGFGNIAKQVAVRSSGWDLNLIAYDPFVTQANATPYSVTLKTFDEVLQESDILSLHMPLNEQTRGMIGDTQFAMMKNSAVIVNTACGGVIQKEALLRALDAGTLLGAGLDNHEQEPITFRR